MFKRPSRFIFSILIGVGILCGLATRANAFGQNKAAWDLLMANQPLQARTEFEKNVQSPDPKVAGEACRGLTLIAQFLGQNDLVPKWVFESFRKDADTLAFKAEWGNVISFSRTWAGHNLQTGYDVSEALSKHPSLLMNSMAAELAIRKVNDGDLGGARELEEHEGLVRQWWAIGPFSNISGSGFDKAYPPESEVDLGKSYEGKNGNQVHWFPLESKVPSTWIYSQNHLPSANGILYFASQVESPRDCKAFISFGASASFKVFVNDRLVLADRVFRNTGEDAFVQEIRLHKGPNRILIKLGNEDRYSNFQARVLDSTGNTFADLKTSAPEGSYPHDPGAAPDLKKSPNLERITAYLRGRLEQDPRDYDAAVLLMDAYDFEDLNDSGEVWASLQLKKHPGSAMWLSFMAEALKRSEQTTRAEEYWKAAYRGSPYCYLGWDYELNRLSKSAEPEAVLNFIRNSPAEFQGKQEALLAAMWKLGQEGRKAEALDAFAKIEAGSEFTFETAAVLAAVYGAEGKKDEAEKTWEKLIQYDHMNVQAYQALGNLYIQSGNLNKAAETFAEGSRYLPDNPDLPLNLANMLMQNKQYPEAEKALAAAEVLAPTHEAVLSLKGNLLLLMGKKDEARKALLQSVACNYNDFGSWDKLQEMDGRPTFESLAHLPPVDSLLDAAKTWDGLKQEKSSIVSYIEDVFYYPSRAVRRRYFMVVYIPSQEAANASTQYDLPYNSNYQTLSVNRAYTHKASNSEVDAEVRGSSVVFKSLEPGDAIVMEWTLKDDYDGDMARQAWGQFPFKRASSTYDTRLRLYMAGDDTIGYTLRGRDIEREDREYSNIKERTFRYKPYTVSPEDRFIPQNDVSAPDVIYSTFSDWSQISNWYANLTENKSDVAPILRRLADSLFQDAASDSQKVARVQQFVSSSISYSSLPFRQSGWVPQAAQEVLASRLGDCKDKAALAKSLLGIAGIQSHLVLVATRNEYDTRPGPIGPYFNHCILAYSLNGRQRYLELTDPNLYWSRLSKYDQGSMALVIEPGNSKLTHLPLDAPSERTIVRKVQFTLSDSGNASIASETLRRGIATDGIRYTYRFLSADEQKTEMRKTLAEDYPDIVLDSLGFGDLSPATDSLPYFYRYHAQGAVKTSGRTRIFNLTIPDKLTSQEIPLNEPHAEGLNLYGVSFSVGNYDQSGSILFPADWKLMDIPAPVTLESPYGKYSLTFAVKGRTLTYQRKASFNLGETVPPEEVQKTRDFLTHIAQSDDIQLVFSKKN